MDPFFTSYRAPHPTPLGWWCRTHTCKDSWSLDLKAIGLGLLQIGAGVVSIAAGAVTEIACLDAGGPELALHCWIGSGTAVTAGAVVFVDGAWRIAGAFSHNGSH